MSNTKLTGIMKSARKEMLVGFWFDGGQLFTFHGFTVAIKPAFFGSNMALVSVSHASPAEQETRRKVGEFFALSKMLDKGEFMQFPLAPENFEYFAKTLYDFLAMTP